MKSCPTIWLTAILLIASLGWANSAVAKRVVSLDYCADQFVLGLMPKDQIAALSMDAERDFSYLRERAIGIPQVRPSAENVLAYQPDVIMRSYGGGPDAKKFYENLGIQVVQIGYHDSIEKVKTEIARLAGVLDQEQKGQALIADMNTRLAALANNQRQSVLYVTPGGITSGTGTLIDELITSAGLTNYMQKPGWHSIPLEQLTLKQPELIATAFYRVDSDHQNFWSASRHPIIKREFEKTKKIALDGATTACGGWFLLDAIESLAKGVES